MTKEEVLSLGSSMGLYLGLAQVYLEVSYDVVHLSKKDKQLKYELMYVLCSISMLEFLSRNYVMILLLYLMVMSYVD